MKKLIFALIAIALALPMCAQNKKANTKKPAAINTTDNTKAQQESLPKVYDESIDAMEQIEKAMEEARNTNRKVICQVGGNWCPWCLRFANFITKDEEIANLINENYVYIHVNTSKENKNFDAMKRLGNPGRFGYPVFVILDMEGNVMQIQSSAYLEQDKSYDRKKVMEFFMSWTNEAIENIR